MEHEDLGDSPSVEELYPADYEEFMDDVCDERDADYLLAQQELEDFEDPSHTGWMDYEVDCPW